ncbi:MAG: substrate-binding domain-containing protein [Ferruginibacter sp.]|nr:substrate-binding domain-containing protein [Cytophagales bacterium]
MNTKKYALTKLAVASLAFLAACGGNDTKKDAATGSDAKLLQIAVIPKGSTHQHWKSVHAGAEKAAQELGVEVIWQGPQKEDDRQMQIQVVQNFVSRGVDALILAPLDDRSLVPPVKAALNRKIPVVIFDSDLNDKSYASYVATNNREGGRLCAQRLAEVMGGKGKALMMRYSEGSASTLEREAGFLDGMKEFGPNIELLSTTQYAGATIERAFQTSQNLLNQFKQVEGIFASNESASQGMLRALQTAGKAGKIKFVGFDSSEALLAGLNKGEIEGLAVQDPFRMGYESVKTAVAVIRGQPYEKMIDTGVRMVTRENVNDSLITAVIHPDLKKWLNE